MKRWQRYSLLLVLPALLLGGCASNPQNEPPSYDQALYTLDRLVLPGSDLSSSNIGDNIGDPWEGMNRRIYRFNYFADRYVMLPAVRAYEVVVPGFVRGSVHNFFNNFRDVRTFVNSILQFSPRKTWDSGRRVVVNTTLGVAGLFDMATRMDMPRPQEDFGQTLGHWGVGTGPYLVLPLLGPSNLRDGVGQIPDALLLQAMREELFADDAIPWLTVLDVVDTRANVSFRYFETGSAFEYDIIRMLMTSKRELDVAR